MLALINNMAGASRVSSCAIAPIPGRSFERWVVARALQQIEAPLSLSLPRLARELSFNRGAFAGPWSRFKSIDVVLLEPESKPADPWAAPSEPRPSPSWVALQIPYMSIAVQFLTSVSTLTMTSMILGWMYCDR